MTWERCSRSATDGIRKERYISVHSKNVVSYGPYSQRHIKTHRCCGKSVGLHGLQVASIKKNGLWNLHAAIKELIQGDSQIENGKFDIVFGSAEQRLSVFQDH